MNAKYIFLTTLFLISVSYLLLAILCHCIQDSFSSLNVPLRWHISNKGGIATNNHNSPLNYINSLPNNASSLKMSYMFSTPSSTQVNSVFPSSLIILQDIWDPPILFSIFHPSFLFHFASATFICLSTVLLNNKSVLFSLLFLDTLLKWPFSPRYPAWTVFFSVLPKCTCEMSREDLLH